MSTMNPVLTDAYYVAQQSIDVSLCDAGILQASHSLLDSLIASPYTTSNWSTTPLHPTPSLHSTQFIVDWIFLVSALNFSFWSSHADIDKRYGIRWKLGVDGKGAEEAGKEKEKVHTGYWSLLAALHRAREEGIDITNSAFYSSCSDDVIRHVFRSDTEEEMPLIDERIQLMRQVGSKLCESFEGSFYNLLLSSNKSALHLIRLLVEHFPSFDDSSIYQGRRVSVMKRAQILVAETWAAFEGKGAGEFKDIDQVTMFADYRVPQILHSFSVLSYSPHLESLLTSHTPIAHDQREEIEIRMCSIAAVDRIRLTIGKLIDERGNEDQIQTEKPNAVLLDFLLWDMAKVEEAGGRATLPHHRTRSVYY